MRSVSAEVRAGWKWRSPACVQGMQLTAGGHGCQIDNKSTHIQVVLFLDVHVQAFCCLWTSHQGLTQHTLRLKCKFFMFTVLSASSQRWGGREHTAHFNIKRLIISRSHDHNHSLATLIGTSHSVHYVCKRAIHCELRTFQADFPEFWLQQNFGSGEHGCAKQRHTCPAGVGIW